MLIQTPIQILQPIHKGGEAYDIKKSAALSLGRAGYKIPRRCQPPYTVPSNYLWQVLTTLNNIP